jgi:L-fucose mutarotase
MLTTRLLHPEILSALGQAGHGARVLVADGNYPFSTESPVAAAKVFLNLRRGLVSVTGVLEVLLETIPIESAMVMSPAHGIAAPIQEEIRRMLSPAVEVISKARLDFYAEAKSPATALVIATGEEHRFANVLLTIGVVRSDPS